MSHGFNFRSPSLRRQTEYEACAAEDRSAYPRAGGPVEVSEKWRRNDQFLLLEPQINAQKVHTWPFDGAAPLDMRLLDLYGDRTVTRNRHDYFEIFVACSGETSLIVEDRVLPMQPGDMAVVGSTLHHTAHCPPRAEARIGALYFDPNFISGDGTAFSAEYLTPFLGQESGFPHVVPTATGLPRRILELMELIQEEMPATSMRGRLTIRTYMKMILILLVNHYATYSAGVDSLKQRQYAMESLRNFLEFLPGHVGELILAQDAACMCNLSEAEFAVCLRQLTGCSFRSYVNQYRVQRAQAALAESDLPISEIAQDMGFCDQSYFGAVFRKFTGITPLAHRHKHRIQFQC